MLKFLFTWTSGEAVIVTTPSWRTLIVQNEDRLSEVSQESRTYLIESEDRTFEA